MKRSKKLIALLICLGVLCAGTALLSGMEEQKEQIKNTGEIILSVSADEVESLRWEYGGAALSFHRAEGWLYDDDEAFPVDGEKIRDMLAQFETFGVSFIIEDVTDFGMYGLDDPECVIEFSTADQSYTVQLGDYSKMDEERYVSIGDGNVYLAKVDPLEKFDAALNDLILNDESLSFEQVSRITFAGEENYTIFREEDSDHADFADDVYFTEQNGQIVPLDTERVDDYLDDLAGLRLTDFVTYDVTEAQLEEYHLVEPELTVTVVYTDQDGAEQTYTLSISRDPEELAAAEQANANGEEGEEVSAYVRVGSSQLVYRISEYNSNNLRAASYHKLCHREVLNAEFEDVIQIDVTLENKEYTLIADGRDDDDARIWKYGEDEVDLSTLEKKLKGLEVEYAADFTQEQPEGRREISLTVHLDSEQRSAVGIDLYRYDGTHCLAVVDGTPLALVPRSDVVALMEAVNAIVLD